MKSLFITIMLFVLVTGLNAQTQQGQALSTKYEELTAPNFVKAVKQAEGVCLLPFGIMEKHGPHLPLGTDLYEARQVATLASEREYCVVFPPYYFGQINEARNQPGTIAYSHEVIWKLLQETCDELSRNGFKKIIIVNGHGGNNDLLNYFCMSQLHSPKDYVLMVYKPNEDSVIMQQIARLKKTNYDGHAGEEETSMIRVIRPDLVKADQASTQSGIDQHRLADIPFQYTGIWWYAQYPNHYAGDGSQSSVELGNLLINAEVDQLSKLIKIVKKSDQIGTIQNAFYEDTKNPLKTRQ